MILVMVRYYLLRSAISIPASNTSRNLHKHLNLNRKLVRYAVKSCKKLEQILREPPSFRWRSLVLEVFGVAEANYRVSSPPASPDILSGGSLPETQKLQDGTKLKGSKNPVGQSDPCSQSVYWHLATHVCINGTDFPSSNP